MLTRKCWFRRGLIHLIVGGAISGRDDALACSDEATFELCKSGDGTTVSIEHAQQLVKLESADFCRACVARILRENAEGMPTGDDFPCPHCKVQRVVVGAALCRSCGYDYRNETPEHFFENEPETVATSPKKTCPECDLEYGPEFPDCPACRGGSPD